VSSRTVEHDHVYPHRVTSTPGGSSATMNERSDVSGDKDLWLALPSATVIVLNHNGLGHLEACFSSLRQLVYPAGRLELMLADNASTDGSVEWMHHKFPEVVIVQHPENYGFSKGNNLAAAKARGQVVAFLNNDMRVDQQWLVELVRPLVADKEVVSSGSKILTWDGKQIDFAGGAMNFYGFGYQVGWGEKESRDAGSSPLEFKPTISVCGGAMLIRREEFLQVGGFDEDFFAYYEDLDLGWRLWVLGYKVVIAPRSLVYHFHHGYWGKVATEKKRVFYERNSLLTIIKNYDDANLRRVLPVALLLLARRAYLSADLSEVTFRAGFTPQRTYLQSSESTTQPTATEPRSQSFSQRRSMGYYLTWLWRKLRRAEWGTIYRMVQSILEQKGSQFKCRMRNWLMVRLVSNDLSLVPREALSYVVAADDVISLYAKMLEKRRLIQAHRKRTDEEVFVHFRLPLQVSYFTGEYLATQRYLERLFEIDKLFMQPMREQDEHG